MGNAAAPKNTTRSFVFQHADSGNCQKPKSQTCLRTAGYHQESRQRIAATTGPAASLSDQRPPALNVAGYLIYEQGPIDFVGTGPPPNLRAPGGDALQVSKLAGRCPGGKRNETLPEPQLAKAFCGSRATLLAILASAICLRIDEFFRLPIK